MLKSSEWLQFEKQNAREEGAQRKRERERQKKIQRALVFTLKPPRSDLYLCERKILEQEKKKMK